MKGRFLPPLIWLLAGVLLCVFFVRMGESAEEGDLSRIFLLYGSLAVADLGLAVHTVVCREDNSSSVNFGYKLLAEGLILLALLAAMLKEIFF